ncbi:phage tail protein [Aureispira anguillae]|uniref:Uncharacterized protein n=1 Tax=Aureispira anguillae TaxID=2864201 RepID=A0A916DXT6_9BACT|nr:hypothetical protein [Aureispira anguillae]BDS15386.1 hypothetical protein AsAng_0061700 [Aureispira anguillae]
MSLEEEYTNLEQESVVEHFNTEQNTNSDDGIEFNPNGSNLPNSEPPPMTNERGEAVWINTTTIRIGTDYHRPKSKVELTALVEEKQIKQQQADLFMVQYEAVYGQLPQERSLEDQSIKEEENAAIDLKTVLPELSAPREEENVLDKPIDLQAIAGENQPIGQPVSSQGMDKGMPQPTATTTTKTDAPPPINLDKIREASESEPSNPTTEVVKTTLPSPESDPAFQILTQNVSKEGDREQRHNSAIHEVTAAEDAAEEPQNKKQSLAEVNQIAKIEAQETPAFNTTSFVSALMQRVEAIMPETEEDADKFKESGKIKEVKEAVKGTVAEEQTKSIGPIEQTTKEQPDQSGISSKNVKPLPQAPIGKEPKDIRADLGMPKPVGQEKVEQPLKENAQELEDKFTTNQITEEQLSKSNEPTFTMALETKKTAQKDSKDASVRLRTEEQKNLSDTRQSARDKGTAEMGGMHQDRANRLTNVEEKQKTTSQNYSAEEKAVADKIGKIYKSTEADVEAILNGLDSKVQQLFDRGASIAQQRFENHVANEMAIYKEERYDGISGTLTWVGDAFTGLPDEVNKFFVEGRNLYVDHMEVVIEEIAEYVAQELNAAKQRVQSGRQAVNDYVRSLPDNLRKVGKKAAADINEEFDALNSQVDAKQSKLIDTLAEKYKENIEQVDTHIKAMKAANRGLIDIALDSVTGVIETILEIKAALTNILSAAIDAITAILLDPIGFLGNLIDGVSTGIANFMTKIEDYLTTGFVEWLTGAMSGAGIEMPENIFSLEGIFSLTTQALGLTWDFIRARAVNILGERPVKAIEDGFEIFQIIRTDGIAGAWEYIKEEFSDLKETIIGSITEMLISEVVQSGIKFLLSMLTPAGAFVKAAMMIVDVAEFFIRQGSQIMELVKAFTESISALAAGAVGKVAQLIERALGISVPLLIGFFTSLLNLGDLAEKVQKIFKKITSRITKAVDGFIEKASMWFKDKKGRRKAKKDQKKEENAKKKKKEGEDKRTDQQKQADLNKGMKRGAAIVNNEELTQQQIKVELNKLELKYRLDDLGADLLQETEDWHLFMLEARLDGKKRSEQIKRKPTKAENEEQVSAEDRKKHEKIAAVVEQKLKAIAGSDDVASFEELYTALKTEAKQLVKTYQPQLRKGIKISIDLINAVEKDKKDGDVDILVHIYPNEYKKNINVTKKFSVHEDRIEQAQHKDKFHKIFTPQDWKDEFYPNDTRTPSQIRQIRETLKWGIDNGKITKIKVGKYILTRMTNEQIIQISVKQIQNHGRSHSELTGANPFNWVNIKKFNITIERLPNISELYSQELCEEILAELLNKKDIVESEEVDKYRFAKIPAKRILPSSWGADDIRKKYYLNDTGYYSLEKKMAKDGLTKIKEVISLLKNSEEDKQIEGQEKWDNLYDEGVLVDDEFDPKKEKDYLARNSYHIDHSPPIAKHWCKGGNNMPWNERKAIATGDLGFIHKNNNWSKGGEGYNFRPNYWWVGAKFTGPGTSKGMEWADLQTKFEGM